MAGFTYRCREFPGMESCVGAFTTATEAELWKVLEVHGRVAHGEDPAKWTNEERAQVAALIRRS